MNYTVSYREYFFVMSMNTTATAVAKFYCIGSLRMIWEFRVPFCLPALQLIIFDNQPLGVNFLLLCTWQCFLYI